MRLSIFALPLLFAAALSACKRDQPAAQDNASSPAAGASASVVAPAAAPTATAAPATAAAATAPATAPPGKAFDLQSVPVTNKALPAFPYLATPSELGEFDVETVTDLEFDRVHVLAGEELRRVEGKVLKRKFPLDKMKWSPLAAHRNYENALKALGATRVDAVHPANEQFVARNGGDFNVILKKTGLPYMEMEDAEVPGFEQWLIRTPQTNIWIAFYVDDGVVGLLTLEEKALKQVVQVLPTAAP